jgi:hypothetical protein
LCFNRHYQESEKMIPRMGKIFTNHISDKGPLCRVHKRILYNSTIRRQHIYKKKKNRQRTWKDISPKKIYKWPTNGKYKSKLQWDTTSHPLAWLESKRQTIASSDKDRKRLEPSYVGGNVKWCRHFGKQSGSFLKVNLALPVIQKFYS